ncbi:Nif3-like dinuclear metal center hexameric protein [Actinophytocola xinjiangensis]|uniref:GTP cyclohydrolase 1 type 2 homolog n=1 Tax=Actinophytocola xinjiangensis TaxID=485602 RepID=A0A7Z1AYN6_9PSEU|nr:Nif3-like dinuclear metal center hexameric protein [Actinophytocola xinjiangensis]OLF10895.1 Nif3-like dinuclear metal center hexameric protein [Actinophytocola xinjiangensis]
MVTVADVIAVLEKAYPPELAEAWDAVGLVCGDPDDPVTRVLICIDPVESTVDEALGLGAQLVVAHHPLFLRGVHGVSAQTPKGRLVQRLVRANSALFCAHTNADSADPGVSDALAAALGLTVVGPLAGTGDGRTGIGRIGELPGVETFAEFVERVGAALPATAAGVRASGDPDRLVRRVAVSGGAGDGYLDAASHAGVDVYVTADLRHHPAAEHLADPGRPALVDVAHWASEWPWCEQAAAILRAGLDGNVDITVSTRRTDPWTVASVPGLTGRMPG